MLRFVTLISSNYWNVFSKLYNNLDIACRTDKWWDQVPCLSKFSGRVGTITVAYCGTAGGSDTGCVRKFTGGLEFVQWFNLNGKQPLWRQAGVRPNLRTIAAVECDLHVAWWRRSRRQLEAGILRHVVCWSLSEAAEGHVSSCGHYD